MSDKCKACKNLGNSCTVESDDSESCEEFDCKEDYCDECFSKIIRHGNIMSCENGCFEEDILNNYSEDELEEVGIDYSQYPEDIDSECQCEKCNNIYCQMKINLKKKE